MSRLTTSFTIAGLAMATMLPSAASAEVTQEQLQELAAKLPESTQVNVLAIASSTSEWGLLEKPFWTELVPKLSGGKIKVKLNSITELGVPGGQMIKLVRSGVYDISDTVASYADEDVKELDAMDISGVSPTIEGIRETTAAIMPVIKDALQQKTGTDVMASWPTTGLVFWCQSKVTNLADLQGKTVRVFSKTLSDFVKALGASPVSMPFAEMAPALQRGVIDCGITGTASGNIAKLPEVTKYVYALNAGWAPQIRIVNAKWLEKQPAEVREWLQLASQYFEEQMAWPTQIRNHKMGLQCTAGADTCDTQGGFTKYDSTVTYPTDAELETVREKVKADVLPGFAASCGASCVESWNATVGKIVNLTMTE
ncbi:TRAP transporter substrate-binding protein DctP [Rhizobium sp. NRK18]|uniref:TRAP transporter substrate-binding protein DctP n=1 Tax=Rhizobium sp. NRK18 TaxID=2964667 RepID=UPI0021C436D3|nr:TRAP transporter substrate-binding protein DctP [Rhizobium sp. NRK18]MCQ2003222.1 TRAP transporter substrate-binding protein DctP [Rhizobium sp. NRK18]